MIASPTTLAQPQPFDPFDQPGEAVSTHTILEVDPYPSPTASASGARLKPIRSVAALTFFERFAAPVQDICRHVDAWGAFEDGAALIGAAALARVSGATFWAQIVVAPQRRWLGIGGELLDIAVQAASRAGGRRLIGSHPATAIEARRIAESQPLLAARRVKRGQAMVVLFISEQQARTSGGQL
jgi:GNAT superfamily N-acetyltransferase